MNYVKSKQNFWYDGDFKSVPISAGFWDIKGLILPFRGRVRYESMHEHEKSMYFFLAKNAHTEKNSIAKTFRFR